MTWERGLFKGEGSVMCLQGGRAPAGRARECERGTAVKGSRHELGVDNH